ncbi:MAG: hypothetical protein NZ561_08300 [Phycisphaerae bacterium]|nr:hypothetical protein [Phycisphaerae bacterium]MDW8262343.1 hypothetical protein [Phycisphaerales bacterium]
MAPTDLQFDSNDTKAYIAIAVGILGLAYLWLRPRLKKRRDPLEKAPFSSLAQQRAVERDMQNLLVELAEMSRQITAQLDTRAAKLNLLICEADRKIAELQRLSDGSGAAAAARRDAGSPADLPPAGSVQGQAHASAPVEGAPPVTAREMPAFSTEARSAGMVARSTDSVDPGHAEVYRLADQGLDAAEIARRLHRPRGEIELILALRPREPASAIR